MKVVRFIALSCTLLVTLTGAVGVSPLRGFSDRSAVNERQYESTFLDLPSAQGALDSASAINAHAHFAGSWGDHQLALYMRDKLRDYGFDATLEEFRANVDTPQKLSLELLTRPKTGFTLTETPDPADLDTQRKDAGPPFNYGSGDGEVTAALVNVDRGLDDDYTRLAARKIDVRGKLVLLRYGAQFRGLLAHRAQDHGAAGVLFYSDPRDDGYARGAVYPNGPYRPAGSIQRGSVGYPPLRIPALPVTQTNANQLIADMAGTDVSKHLVHLRVKMYHNVMTIWNTIGKIQGTDPTQSVILGGHRDAWVYGVTDNGAGISTLLEAARGLGYLRHTAWRPKRTIVIAGWDAEELGELGSKEYVRVHQTELKSGCVAYINADENVSGAFFGADAAGALASSVVAASQSVRDPQTTQISLYDRWKRETTRGPLVQLPGGGSDHEPFLFDLGIPTANLGFGGPFGAYHSQYDDISFAKMLDPGFTLHRTVAQMLGILALRLADAEAVPYRFTPYVSSMRDGVLGVETAAAARGKHPDLRTLRGVIDQFAAAARSYDSSVPDGSRDRQALAAVQLIDSNVYGRSGYARSAYPKIAEAIATGNAASVDERIAQTVAAIEEAAKLIR